MIVSDGAGGAIVTWQDYRSGSSEDIYAQRVNAAGVTQWLFWGVPLCTALTHQQLPMIVSDGAGGAIVTWQDGRGNLNADVYAQRVSAAGVPQWTLDGVALSTFAAYLSPPTIASDGAGGAIITWQDGRGATGNDIYAQRVSATGVPLWTVNGVALCTAANDQQFPTIISDGSGGAIVTWYDYRSDYYNPHIYAQRVDRYGRLGNPAASLTTVSDFPADQGGKVRIVWTASYLDALPTLEIGDYGIWRRVSAVPALAAAARGATVLPSDAPAEAARPGTYRMSIENGQTIYWEGVGSVLARGYASYTFVAPTFADSTAASNPYSVFMVDAHAAFSPGFWDSNPDSGYSVDNLPPGTPAPFAGTYSATTTHLHWGPNTESDLANYRLYRGSSAGFMPGGGNLIAVPRDTGYVDPAGAPYFYKLSAVDIHSNESGFALVQPAGTTDAPRGGASALFLAPAAPNPMREEALIRFGLARDSHVTLSIYDQQGRRVRGLVSDNRSAGEQAVRWDRRDGAGRAVPSGLYFLRLEAEGQRFTERIVAMR